jgi:hypothetical protein
MCTTAAAAVAFTMSQLWDHKNPHPQNHKLLYPMTLATLMLCQCRWQVQFLGHCQGTYHWLSQKPTAVALA